MAGEDFAAAARAARDAAVNQWEDPNSTLNQGVEGARDQWNREDSAVNRAWDWISDGLSKHFKRQSSDPSQDGTYNAPQVLTAIGLSWLAGKFLQNNVTGAPQGAFGLVLAIAVGMTASAGLGHLGASQGLSDVGRDLVSGNSGNGSSAEYASYNSVHPDELEAG